MKTSELTGAALDWAVAKCEGRNIKLHMFWEYRTHNNMFHYSTDWAQGGSIIEREGISPKHWGDDWETPWSAAKTTGHYEGGMYFGPTPLIAAMRCYVASRLGDDVTLPDGLV
jgi:hypothetical protein